MSPGNLPDARIGAMAMKRRAVEHLLSHSEVSAEVRAMVDYLETQGATSIQVIVSRPRKLYLRYTMVGNRGITLPCKIRAEQAVFRILYPGYRGPTDGHASGPNDPDAAAGVRKLV